MESAGLQLKMHSHFRSSLSYDHPTPQLFKKQLPRKNPYITGQVGFSLITYNNSLNAHKPFMSEVFTRLRNSRGTLLIFIQPIDT
jgi:hypothetical protein